ncbi:MAG TPA: Eco57I restriction-modification methylase domain-containing protein [Candidatus Avisuccinivibrio pullicola]|nr:Eco57I restriction-modification methylase domain-containing protein [Candidatus Avisuccinivibrio pullicola]
MKSRFGNAFEYKLIYVFAIHDDAHQGLLKIGETTIRPETSIDSLSPNSEELKDAALKRIRQYTSTAGIAVELLYTELATRTVKNEKGQIVIEAFHDHDVHRVLLNSNIERKKPHGVGDKGGIEWFEVDLDTVIRAIEAVKKSQTNLSGIALPKDQKPVPIVFRPEQQEAIDKTFKHFKTGDRMLWNAKMRFGKTLTALQLIKKSGFKKTIIVTHRPVVDDGWYKDFNKIFTDKEIIYGSRGHGNDDVEKLIDSGKDFIYFASLQDLRGSSAVGGKFDKNDAVFQEHWDLVIVDEAHEGTTTDLGDEVIKNIVKEGDGYHTKLLALSGTPFNIARDYDEESTFVWDYVMEQRSKAQWYEEHFGDSNPYDELPELNIYTYDLGKILTDKSYVELEDKAFNFREFFRVWTGDIRYDHKEMPLGAQTGDFVHEVDVKSFLNLITRDDPDSYYPYANDEYRALFRHALWVVPGVKEARALSRLLKQHPVFGMFDIVNVAGDGDEEESSDDALKKVRDAIDFAGSDGYTITLSCGRLTTGVTVPEWTAVFMLAGSYSTSAANYLQTIFRVQSPCNKDGRVKRGCYAFDFAPDRTLKMVAEAAALSSKTKAGKTKPSDRAIMSEFLNYCSVIAVSGTKMKPYDTSRLLQQLKRAYAERAVLSGFDDNNLYNDELLQLDNLEYERFKKLGKIVGSSRPTQRIDEIDINDQGFTDEKHEHNAKDDKKPPRNLSEEEKKLRQEQKERQKKRKEAISILRGISIRMPLMIYGANIPMDEDITMESLIKIVDDTSWDEFMPNGVTKEMFRDFIRYYDPDVFVAASRRIRAIAENADSYSPLERVKKITELFSYFKNPDKETVLTPWRVVNMHLSDCLGGYDFFDDHHEKVLSEPRFVDRGKETADTFANPKARILEINSKTGLYPLYVTYSIFRSRCAFCTEELTDDKQRELWDSTVKENVFVLCKTPMARQITIRTLIGYRNVTVNAVYFNHLIDTIKNDLQHFTAKLHKSSFWNKGDSPIMQFNAVVGNPPYQIPDGGSKASATPVYNHFVDLARNLKPDYVSMIIPARWYSAGRGLEKFRESMLQDPRIQKLFDFSDSNDCFKGVDIAGGICYFLWNRLYDGTGGCRVLTNHNGSIQQTLRKLNENSIFVRHPQALTILNKVKQHTKEFYASRVSPRKPFGLTTNVVPTKDGDLILRCNKGTGPFRRELVTGSLEWVDKWKVIISYLSYDHAGRADKNGQRRILSTIEILPPHAVCTETYLVVDVFDDETSARNLLQYLKTKFVRFMLSLLVTTQHITKSSFADVPILDMSKVWTDDELYTRYKLTDEEISFIESMIKPML